MNWLKQNIRWILCGFVGLCLGGAFGFLTGVALPEKEPSAQTVPAEPVGQMRGHSILPDTSVTVMYMFEKCGHVRREAYLKQDLLGYTKADIQTLWADARILTFLEQEVLIQRQVHAYCPDHYVLSYTPENGVYITRTDEGDYFQQQITKLDYDVDTLSVEALRTLEQEQVFDNLLEINAFMEDVES